MSDDDFISRIIASAEQVVAYARRIERDHDLVAIVRANALSLKEAADALECSDETVRRACKRTAATKYAIGVKFKGKWMVDKTRLPDWVERKKGVNKRKIVEKRLRHARPRELV